MSLTTHQLDPLTFPLTGSALIEASAGTGKTYTLALLYLRLVLKHGAEHSFTDHLLPPNILVVTFTKAATRELRDRIRARLVEAAEYFRDSTDSSVADVHLQALKDAFDTEHDLKAAARRLDVAAEWMDEAAVSTIHSWCSRVLSEHAFYSGLSFQQTLLENEKPLIIQACEDYWREMVFTLDEPELRQVLKVFGSPNDLFKIVNNLIYQTHAIAPVNTNLTDALREIEQDRQAALKNLKEEVRSVLSTLIQGHEEASKNKLYKATSLNSKHRTTVFETLERWTSAESESLSMLTPLFKAKSLAKIALLDTSHWFDQQNITIDRAAAKVLAQLQGAVDTLPTPNEFLISHSAHWVAKRVDDEKNQRGVLSQNDLLNKLDQALQSEGGERLADVIRKQFPVALVDEFQDTDPVQYRIFNTIYNVAEPYPNTGFFMIGDPKQAIYRFRGADIFTYLSAKQDTGDRQYTLTHNFRSSPELVTRVNRFFEHAESAQPKGAFQFRSAEQNPIPFQSVQAGKKDTIELLINGQRHASQALWDLTVSDDQEGEASSKTPDRAKIAAAEIAHLLNSSQAGEATINLGNGERAIQPKDFAVLVNSGNEARKLRRALFELNVSSVYLSDASDVFDTDDAEDVLRVLRAMAEPFNSFHLRVALGCRLMGLSLAQLDRLNHDEVYWESFIECFRDYHAHWHEFGVMPTLHRFFTDQKVPERYLQAPNGERAVTDLFHISELLQQASETIQGQQALIHHLEQRISAEKSGEESTQQRLESDADLVQVVTVHKSKGLQYPLVMLPFLDYARPVKATDFPIDYHDEAGNLALTFNATTEQLEAADFERLAEDVRKIYVAMTRAICAQWVAIGGVTESDDDHGETSTSAAHRLVFGAGDSRAEKGQPISEMFAVVSPKLSVSPYQVELNSQFRAARVVDNLGIDPWWISSYSSLSFGGKEGEAVSQNVPSELPIDEQIYDDDADQASDSRQTESQKLMHRLPRGSHIGTFLHGVIEWAAEQRTLISDGERLVGFAAAQADETLRMQMLEARCRKRGLAGFVPELSDWLQTFLNTRWHLSGFPEQPSVNFRFCDLSVNDMSVEMEFMFEANKVNTQRLDSLVRQYTWGGLERPAVNFQQLQGMFKGFIDLIAKVDGKYYVIDWKSNGLGTQDADYCFENLREALLKKRYDLQYVLYLVALHRHLKDRIPKYDYDTHVGGAVYYFLRGFENPQTQGLIMDKPPKHLIETLDAMFSGRELSEAYQQELVYV